MASISQAKFFVAAILCIASGSAGSENLMQASTTSTEQSGLFAYPLPLFKQAGGLDMKVRAVGTGQALDLARRGDSDALLIQNQARPASQRGGGDRECGCGVGRAEHGHRLQSMRAVQ